MTEFYDISFLAPPILNAQNKIFGPKLARSSGVLIILTIDYIPVKIHGSRITIEWVCGVGVGQQLGKERLEDI